MEKVSEKDLLELKKFAEFLISNFLDKENFKIDLSEEEKQIRIDITVKKNMLGKILGKNGKLASSIREIAKSLPNIKKRVYINFDEEK